MPITSGAEAASAAAADGHLSVDGLSQDLKARSTRGGAMMIASHAVQLGIGVAGTAILARVLRPTDFGYLAMVVTVTNFFATFRDFGLTTAAVQRNEITHEQTSGLFWVNAAASIGVAVLVAALAPVLAWFYGEPKLAGITLVMAVGVLAGSLGMTHAGLLRRQMRFGAVAALEIGAMVAGFVVGVSAAVAGAGYWALVYQQLAIWVWQTVAAWVLCRWRPARRGLTAVVRDAGLRSMLRYGKDVTTCRMIEYASRNLDAVLVGHFAGARVLGLYQKAYLWSMLPFWQVYTPMLSVAVSSFSRLQDDLDRYRGFVRNTLLGLFAVTLPAMALLFVEAEGVILLLFGSQWVDAIPIFRVLAVGGYFTSFVLVTKWLYLSEGRTADQLRWALVAAPVTVLGVAVGIRWGAIGVAAGFAMSAAVLAVPGVWYCLRRSPFRAADFLGAIWRPVVASVAAAAVLWLTRARLPVMPHLIVQVVFESAVYALLYGLVWVILPGGRIELARAVGHLRSTFRSRSAAS